MSKRDKLSTEPYKGVRDFYPEDQAFLNYVVSTMRSVAHRFGYEEYHASILEPAELYKAKGAENAEIVSEQTYTFTDRGEREVALRPEMTPTVARMVAARRRDLGFPLRMFSIPNLFRYERPQRGRLREHWQLNVDIFGSRSLLADAEIIRVASEILKAFGATEDDFIIKLGSRNFLDSVISALGLSEEQGKKLLGLLDRKGKLAKEEFESEVIALGVALEQLSPENIPDDVAEVIEALRLMGIENVEFDPSIVRGFNYYTGVVFEVFDTHPDNNRALMGGGRYDNLLALFDDEVVPGVGFGMGDVTVKDFLEVRGLLPAYVPQTHVYLASTSPEMAMIALGLADELRSQGVNVAIDFGDKKLGDQIKAASKHKIPFLIVVGETEMQNGRFTVRNLQSGGEEQLSRKELAQFFENL